jgi:uncharacterized protein YbjT (DUF2867 family)
MRPESGRPRLLLVGGGGGLVGRAMVREFSPAWKIRSIHRHPAPEEERADVEWIRADAATMQDWSAALSDVDLVVNLAWYRAGSSRRFARLADGLLRLIFQSRRAGTARFVQVSVPPATASIESSLPYMVQKRRVDSALQASGISHVIVRPTMLFGPRDKLLTVMLATMARYRRFPMFGDGEYHLSPIAVTDLARILHREARTPGDRVVLAGGPSCWQYRALTDAMFAELDLRPRYVHFSERGSIRLARVLESLGSSRLYAYEVEWLMADLLGLPPYEGLDPPLVPVAPFLANEARRLRGEHGRVSG